MGQFSLRISPGTIFNIKIILTLLGFFLAASCLPAPEPEHVPEPAGDGSGVSDDLFGLWDFGTEPEPEPFGRKKRGITLTQQCQENNPGGSITIGIQFPDDDTHEDSDEDFDED